MTDTNLPELPEGQRWSVVKVFDDNYIPARTFYEVRRESKKWWGWSWADRLSIETLNAENIACAAEQICNRRERDMQTYQQEQKYLGAYPPKTLG